MVRHYTRADLIQAIKAIIAQGACACTHRGHGRAGRLLEDLLGIAGGNYDVADAVGFESKTSSSSNTPITLLHKDPQPRNSKQQQGAVNALIANYGWDSTHQGQPVRSFRATLYGKWSNAQGDVALTVHADDHKIRILHEGRTVAWWDTNELVGTASAKLRNILYVNAQTESDGKVRFVDAQFFSTFAPLRFLNAINQGLVAIDFDARTNPGKTSIRNHGTKFRIREKDIRAIYQKIEPL